MKKLKDVISDKTIALNTFFYVLVKSFSSFDYYIDIVKAPFKFSFKFLMGLTLLASIVTTTKAGITIFRETEPNIKQSITGIVAMYPKDLVINIKSGEMTTNTTEEILIKNPSFGSDAEIGEKENIILISENGILDDLETKKTLMVLNKRNLLIQDLDRVTVYPLSKLPDLQIDEALVQKSATEVQPKIKFIPYIITMLLFGATFIFYFVTRAIYLIAVACVLWGFSILIDGGFKFSKLYQFAIHAMTLPALVAMLLELLPRWTEISFLFPLLNIVVGIGGLLHATRKIIEE